MTVQPVRQRVIQCSPGDGWQGLALALAQARPGDHIRCAPVDFEGSTPLQVPSGVSLQGVVGARLWWSGEGPTLVVKDVRDVMITAIQIEAVGRRDEVPESPEGGTEALLLMRDVADVQTKGCVVRGGGGTSHGILIHRGRTVLIEECVAEGCRNGIASLASVWTGKANNCSGNSMNGITLECDRDTPQAPSEAELIVNRCHDNQQAGIVFSSVQGRAEANECWANGMQGIVLGRDPRSPQAASDAVLIANRCDHNDRAGIAFVSSNGRCGGNRCWANQGGGWPEQEQAPQDPKLPHLGLLPACQVSIARHDMSVLPSSSLDDERLAARTDKALVEALRGIATPCPTTLADYLASGCPRCFERFWFGTASTPPETTEVTAERASPVPVDQARCYRLGRSAADSPSLVRAQRTAKRRTPSSGEDPLADSVASFAAVLSDFVAAWLEGSRWSWSRTPAATTSRGANQESAGPRGLTWSLALVSVETATLDAELAALRQATVARIRALAAPRLQDLANPAVLLPRVGAPLVAELADRRFDGRPLRDWLEEALLAEAPLDTATAVARADARAEPTHSGPSLGVSLSAGWRRARRRLSHQIREILTLPFEVSLSLLLVAFGLGLWLAWDLAGLAACKGLWHRTGCISSRWARPWRSNGGPGTPGRRWRGC
jgi:hypothetical protein